MGLEFKKTASIKFGDIVATPKMTVSQRLRLQTFKEGIKTEEDWAEARDYCAGCFPDQKEEVARFIDDYFTIADFQKLLAFLLVGETGVKKIEGVYAG